MYKEHLSQEALASVVGGQSSCGITTALAGAATGGAVFYKSYMGILNKSPRLIPRIAGVAGAWVATAVAGTVGTIIAKDVICGAPPRAAG